MRVLALCCLLATVEGALIHGVAAMKRTASSAASARAPRSASAQMAQTVDGVRIGPPPDLPSLLLNNRIIYLGMPLVPSVTELIVAQLLYLNYDNPSKSVYMYINSVGNVAGQAFETESFAIADTMNYIQPELETICVGTAFGTATMLLANGEKGKRTCLPNASIMLHQPRSGARGQASDIAIKAREVLQARSTILGMLSEKTGQPVDKIERDSSRTNYMTPQQAKEYGIIDKILVNEDDLPQVRPDFTLPATLPRFLLRGHSHCPRSPHPPPPMLRRSRPSSRHCKASSSSRKIRLT